MISHPDKVLFPDDGITKGEVAAYYAAIAPLMLPHLRGRPVTMERFPAGIGQNGFLQKDVSKGFPEWLERVEAPKKGGVVHYPLVDDARSLEWLANQNCITPHVWTSRAPEAVSAGRVRLRPRPVGGRTGRPARTRRCAVRDVLDGAGPAELGQDLGLEGLSHRRAAGRLAGFDEVAAFAQRLGAVLVAARPRAPDPGVQQGRPRRAHLRGHRPQRLQRHVRRGVCGARQSRARPVSAPCTWEEVERGEVGPQTFTLRTMAARVDAVGDLWADMLKRRRSLAKAMARLAKN